jgi:alkylhydroperoxidase family enzyme
MLPETAPVRRRDGDDVPGRLPRLSPDDLEPAQQAVYDAIAGGPRAAGPQVFRLLDDAGRLEGPFNAMLHAPGVGLALQDLGAAVRYRTTLPDRCREIAILTLAAVRRSAFEWYAHARVGRQAGLSETELEELRALRAPDSFSAAESVTRDLVLALMQGGDLDDDEFARGRDTLGLEQVVELVTLVGYYDLLALSLRVFRTPLPEGVDPEL